jgi:hypothetical protein
MVICEVVEGGDVHALFEVTNPRILLETLNKTYHDTQLLELHCHGICVAVDGGWICEWIY